jgi:hypothetical protein
MKSMAIGPGIEMASMAKYENNLSENKSENSKMKICEKRK